MAARQLILALLFCVLGCLSAYADGTAVQAGGYTDEVCTGQQNTEQLTVTTNSAYSANNQVAQIVSLPFARPLAANGRPSGVLMNVRMVFNDVQTAEFDVRLYTAQPSAASTLVDKTAQSLSGTDKLLQLTPTKLTNNDSVGGTTTVYGQDEIGRVLKIAQTNIPLIWATITTPGTPTFTDAHPQLCIGVLQD